MFREQDVEEASVGVRGRCREPLVLLPPPEEELVRNNIYELSLVRLDAANPPQVRQTLPRL